MTVTSYFYSIISKKSDLSIRNLTKQTLRGKIIMFHKNDTIDDLWKSGELDLKQRFQKLIFPENISYKKGRFRTTKIALIFKALDRKSSLNYYLAPLTFASWNQIVQDIRNIYKLKELINLPVSAINNV